MKLGEEGDRGGRLKFYKWAGNHNGGLLKNRGGGDPLQSMY